MSKILNEDFVCLGDAEIDDVMSFDIVDEETDDIENLADVDITEVENSMKDVETSSDEDATKVRAVKGRSKKTINQIADDVVNDFLATKSNKSWQQLQEFFWYGIKQFSYKYTQDWDDAYDMTIETFTSAWKNMDKFDASKARFSTWLWTICRNNCMAFMKNKAKIPTINNDISDIYESELLNSVYTSENEHADFRVEAGHTVRAMHHDDVVNELYNTSVNEMHNIGGVAGKILEMKLVKDMKIREIADELNMNESTVKDYLYKSKANLAKIIRINHKDLYDMYADNSSREYGSL